ncbi:MAG: glycine cleavage system aminomethyltransferase GcvT [Pseudomonadota bacterium]
MTKQTPLFQTHQDLNAKIAEFAGYDMPIQYPDGVLTEHNWCRESAGIFDVSHMGQLTFKGDGVIAFLEKVTPSSYGALPENGCKYSVLTNDDGGIVDDLILTKISDTKFKAVVNGACKEKDIAWLQQHMPEGITLTHHEDRALIVLQGPKAEQVLREALGIDASDLNYMKLMQTDAYDIYRLGYTGEDGFEISMPNDQAVAVWEKLNAHDAVKPVGLAARDSLRLEMGYPLYGHDIDATTSPIEADIKWIMGKVQNKDFIGASRVLNEIDNGPKRTRIGFELIDKGVAREGAEIFDASGDQKIGVITSGTFSPTLQKAIGMAYIDTPKANLNDEIIVRVRNRDLKAKITAFPFLEARTKKTVKKAA